MEFICRLRIICSVTLRENSFVPVLSFDRGSLWPGGPRMPAHDQVFYGTSGSSLSEGFVFPTEYTYPCIFVFEPHPLGYQPAEPLFEFLPFFPRPFRLQTAWYPWGGCRPFFSKGVFDCCFEFVVVSPPLAARMRYPWGKCPQFVSSSFCKCLR